MVVGYSPASMAVCRDEQRGWRDGLGSQQQIWGKRWRMEEGVLRDIGGEGGGVLN